ncbi:hypothetical protein [Sporosarcina sp. Te-1]|uniref:hypothetical protein n=1 Tax=Sporosarcina sp. Te-1 TaxID=2818390 RepID=UPI001A9D23C6|nr:hypothetical protein [Sporosarcina sp. Te-1]QTD41838.1 hypothetical protein J3U78_03010 [Sporosarcina sp. Te-1]
MGGWMITVAVVFLIYAMVKQLSSKQMKRTRISPKLQPPIWADQATKQLFKQFNLAWTPEIEKVVNERYRIQDGSFPNLEIQARWYELKKYLLLASFSKGLPMFSQKVDDVWHLFLEEDALYNRFCKQFIGERIEHHPHGKPKHLPAERSWFDILYLSFFPISTHSHLWGDFLREKEEHEKWMQQLHTQSTLLKTDLGKRRVAAPTLETMEAFLAFAQERLEQKDDKLTQRVQQPEGYWYGAALFGVGTYGAMEMEEQKRKQDGYGGESGGYAGSAYLDKEREEDWQDLTSDVNDYQPGSDTTSQSSPAGSGCSSCSSCSSCSGCSS